LLSQPTEYAVINWTSVPRYDLELGFELYSTRQHFIPNTECLDHNLNNIKYTKEYLSSIRDRFTALAHDCFEILNVVEYTNSIIKLSKQTGTQVFFVNAMCPWDSEFFSKKTSCLPAQYTKYTQNLLNVDNRSDDQIFQLYDLMHKKLDDAGGINESSWLNLYDSMYDNKIDTNSDNMHPGPHSNNRYVEMFSNSLSKLL